MLQSRAVRYLATAAAVAESSERSGGNAGMVDARSVAAGGAIAEAARKRKAAYGIPPRPSAATAGAHEHTPSAAAAKPVSTAPPPAAEPSAATKRRKSCTGGETLASASNARCADRSAVAGAKIAAEAAQHAASSRQAAACVGPESQSDCDGDMLMLEEDDVDFAVGSQAVDAHMHAVHVVRRLGE